MPDVIEDDCQLSERAWMVDIRSRKSGKIYTVRICWDDTKHEWMGITCTCKGFQNRSTCRHLKDSVPLLASKHKLKKPMEKPTPLVQKYWMECAICGNTLFYIKPPVANIVTTIIVCSKCGRMTEI